MAEPDLSLLVRNARHAPTAVVPQTEIPPPRLRWKTRIALPGAILLITSGLLATAASDAFRPATLLRVVPVIVRTDVDAQPPGGVVLQAPGWVEADPFPTAVSALADGVVEEVLVLEGERIQAGQVVARLVAQDARIALEQADAVLAERHADLAIARAALEEAQRNWEHPIELSRQKQTAEAQLAEIRAELARWPSELAREEARSVYLTADYERIAPLHKNGQASDIELIQARQAHQAQQAEIGAVRGRKPILEARVWALETEVWAATDNLRLRIKDTRALAEAKATVQRAEAAITVARARRDEAALRLERMQVHSPSGGIVMSRLVEPGSKVMLNMDHPRSAQVVRLYDPNRLQVRVDVPLVDAAKVGVGQPAEVIVEVLPDKVFHGQVTRVVHEADVQKNTLQVKVAIEDPTPEIKPEMLGRARFLAVADSSTVDGRESNLRLFVPKSTVFERAGRSFVWLADHMEEVARLRAIEPGRLTLDDWVAVAEGLRPGDRVIVDAPADLEDGQRILPVEQ